MKTIALMTIILSLVGAQTGGIVEYGGVTVRYPYEVYRGSGSLYISTIYAWERIESLAVINSTTGDALVYRDLPIDDGAAYRTPLADLAMAEGRNQLGVEVRLGGKESVLVVGIQVFVR